MHYDTFFHLSDFTFAAIQKIQKYNLDDRTEMILLYASVVILFHCNLIKLKVRPKTFWFAILAPACIQFNLLFSHLDKTNKCHKN